jgi:SnoaL-like domain
MVNAAVADTWRCALRYEEVRELLLHQWKYTGGPNEAKASELYHDDAVLEFPQSGERFSGKANIQGWREKYPARLGFEPREIRGSGDIWVAEGRLHYDDGAPIHFVKLIEFRGDKVQRETLYFTEPFPAPEWRRPWADQGPGPERRSDLPAYIEGGTR